MKLRILTLAKGAEPRLAGLEEEYRLRLSRFFPAEFVELRRGTLRDPKGAEKDWKKIEPRIGNSFLVILDEKGRSFTSAGLAGELARWSGLGRDVSLVIGGPEGLPEAVKKRADLLLSLSPLTLPHRMVRLVLVEALYRAGDILRGGPYHRG